MSNKEIAKLTAKVADLERENAELKNADECAKAEKDLSATLGNRVADLLAENADLRAEVERLRDQLATIVDGDTEVGELMTIGRTIAETSNELHAEAYRELAVLWSEYFGPVTDETPEGECTPTAMADALRKRLEALEQSRQDAIEKALRSYCCQNTLDDDENHLPLVDALSHGPTIADGIQELELLAEYVVEELSIDNTPPEEAP